MNDRYRRAAADPEAEAEAEPELEHEPELEPEPDAGFFVYSSQHCQETGLPPEVGSRPRTGVKAGAATSDSCRRTSRAATRACPRAALERLAAPSGDG